MKKGNIQAFTLIELIVTITILSVLSTIAYLSFSEYNTQVRDSVRLSDIKTIYTGLNYYRVKNNKVPQAQVSTNIQIGGNTISYQSDLSSEILTTIGMNDEVVDPRTKQNYIYMTDNHANDYQVAAFLEIDNPAYALSSQIYADNQNLFYSKGGKLGVIEDNSGDLVHKVVTTFDISNALGDVTAYFSRGNKFTGTGPELIAEIQK